jgi:hypothetical protein
MGARRATKTLCSLFGRPGASRRACRSSGTTGILLHYLQGISILENVDSESAEELLEEGQAFEAGVISGVEDAPDADKSEVTTHEVPQDDVPGEYYDKDRP